VRRGDTLSRIARRFGVSEQDLAAQNRLTNRNSLQVGQVLQLPGGRVVPTSGDYTVRPGDTLTDIARRHGVSVQEILALNRLMNRNQLRVGQTLRLPVRGDAGKDVVADVPKNAAPEVEPEVAEAPAPAESEVAGAAEPVKPEVAEVPNYAAPEVEPEVADAAEPAEPEVAEVPKNAAPEVKPEVADATEPAEPEPAPASATPEPTLADAGQPAPTVESGESRPDAARLALVDDGSLRVAPEETLGHYADWLEIPTQRLRDLNRLRFGAALTLGQRIRLDFAHVSRREFEHRRLAFHQGLHQRFFRENRVTGTEEYVLERGDTLWVLSQRKLAVPVWLLTAYNPDVDFGAPLRPGQRLRVPRVEPSS
jgi:membrane-bound lytic murein transglycosylase D